MTGRRPGQVTDAGPSVLPGRLHLSRPRALPWLGLLGLILAGGCATTADCPIPAGPREPTPATVAAAVAVDHSGRIVQWGGVLIETRNRRDRTELEVLGYPLATCGRPRVQERPMGRFIIVRPGYFETGDLEPGRLITVTGPLLGTEPGQVGAAPYRFPLLESDTPHVWPVAGQAPVPLRPWVTIGIGSGRGGIGGGVGVSF